MTRFAIVPIIALILYLFMFISLIVVKKNDMINQFIKLLLNMIAWTSGSFFMRLDAFPGSDFWFQFSLIGILLFVPSLSCFIKKYLNLEKSSFQELITGIIIVLWAMNCFVPFFIESPKLIAGHYVYHFSWPILFMFLVIITSLCHLIYRIYLGRKKHIIDLKQLFPIFMGVLFLIVGHLCLMLPIFSGFPIDVLSGIPMAICLFYALYKESLLQLDLLVSRASCYYMALIIVMIIFYEVIPVIDAFMRDTFDMSDVQSTLLISLIVMISTISTYGLLHWAFDHVFGKSEVIQSDCLQNFTKKASQLMHSQEILKELETVLKKGLHVDQAYIYLKKGDEFVSQSDSNVIIHMNEKVLKLFHQNDNCLLIKNVELDADLMQEIHRHHIECLFLICDGDKEIGMISLPHKIFKEKYTYNDINYLKSLCSVGIIALQNAELYDQTYWEARKDYLTSVSNRRRLFEVLETCRHQQLFSFGSFIMVSVDDFKLYNQLYGDEAGDIALQRIAKTIQECIGLDDLVARYSGKVFAVILPGKTADIAYQVASAFSKKIIELNQTNDVEAMKVLTVSCGISCGDCLNDGYEKVLHQADEALYYAKQTGKNRIEIYTEGQIEKKTSQVKGTYSEYASTIYALTAAIDAKDHYTFSHSENVAYYAQELAKAYGMNEEAIQIVYEAGLLHDIGKIGIDESILNKPGQLSADEYEQMKKHVELSIGIIRHLPSLDYVIPAVIGHHERYDGRGYPRGIAGRNIPLMARILAIADSFDAMLSKRSYKPKMSIEKTVSILKSEAGYQFDPKLVDLFVKLIETDMIELKSL